ncbi:glycoside hydrolase family 27 protein [Terriglobus roseus]|uniref:Alpha-galactosidase n=1 Tax=Terriglobus roseus TaxID=392734 RepID=A0A1G7MGJ1_9BACT|nr:glycoside hydrolase family 27 protein [Terriglobus roseus]SDF60734.1 Alpha galactosidase A [Terriglobus roseus]
MHANWKRIAFFATVLASFATPLTPAQHLAPTPPMGWNSWDSYGTTVRESEVKANTDAMAGLKRFGWEYIVVDIQWYEPNAKAHGYRAGAQLAMDSNGRLVPAANRFPSAKDGAGFKQLATYVHSKGLKFGIHIMRGIPRQAVAQNTPIRGTALHAADVADRNSVCTWNTDMYGVDMTKPGAQAYYDSLVAMYASWGVDFIKADDMLRPYHDAEIEGLHKAIVHSRRPIVLSLSPGPAPVDKVASLRANAQMWRIEDDLWDDWKSVRNMASRMENWWQLVEPGHWPDADMLPLGHIGIRAERGDDRQSRLTQDEQKTMMTLWGVARSPLMFGGDLATLDPFTRSLLTNVDVLAVNQHGNGNKLAYKEKDLRIWTARTTKGGASDYIAMINLGDQPIELDLPWASIGITNPNKPLRDTWTGTTLPASPTLHIRLNPHASMLLSSKSK